MSSIGPLSEVGIYIFFLVTGVIGNLFILTVHFLDWLRTRDFNPSILIINSISLINIIFQGAITFDRITFFMFVGFYIQDWVVKPLVVILSSLAFSSLWSSTCLCFYYCIKIANFNGSFFYKVKAKAPVIVPWLLIICIAASWAVGVSAYLDLYMDIKPVTALIAGNITLIFSYSLRSRCRCIYHIYMLNFLLLLYLIFYGFLSSLFSEVENYGNFIFLISYIVVSGFPTFNSIILIMGNRKLSDSVKRLLCMRPQTNTEVTITTH
ncbi:taste receptor type 2 member 9-like [Anomaloglossus baeobatrachus]|uniref:taste receptor type 2 member 9-like n=1 Tax=Anomaloglossus baeobatrachus TaxID=238106 RepID=UPI003F4F4621